MQREKIYRSKSVAQRAASSQVRHRAELGEEPVGGSSVRVKAAPGCRLPDCLQPSSLPPCHPQHGRAAWGKPRCTAFLATLSLAQYVGIGVKRKTKLKLKMHYS